MTGPTDPGAGVGDLILPDIPDDGSHVVHLFVVRTARRDDMLSYLHERGVMAGIHYPTPIHLHGAFHHLDEKEGAFPVSAESLAREIISLPLYPELTDQQLDRVADVVKAFFEGGPKDVVARPSRSPRVCRQLVSGDHLHHGLLGSFAQTYERGKPSSSTTASSTSR